MKALAFLFVAHLTLTDIRSHNQIWPLTVDPMGNAYISMILNILSDLTMNYNMDYCTSLSSEVSV